MSQMDGPQEDESSSGGGGGWGCGGCTCEAVSASAEEEYAEELRLLGAQLAAGGLRPYEHGSRRRRRFGQLVAGWRARKVPVRNPKYPPRQAWQVSPALRARVEAAS